MASLARTNMTPSPTTNGVQTAAMPDDVAGGSGVRQFLIVTFLVLAIIPVYFSFGTVRMSPYRMMLLAAFFPLVGAWLSGKAGRILPADWLLLAFSFWTIIATFGNHGTTQIQFSGIFFIETFGAYLLGRVLIRGLEDFIVFAKTLFWILLLFIPFGWAEAVQRESVYISFFEFMGDTIPPAGIDIRWGLNRAQVAFEHPILYGMFAASTFSILFYTPRPDRVAIAGLRRAWATLGAAFFSLSSGAFSPIGVQALLMLYNRILRNVPKRWLYLAIVGAIGYVVLDLLSNRTPFEVIASRLAFSGSTYYWRVLIYQYGIANVWADPLFGSGLLWWARPSWMSTGTVDNFWLVIAMRYGVPGFLIFATFYALTVWGLIRAKLPVQILSSQRYGAVFTLIAMAVGISTVWLWNSVYVYFLFLIGSSSWLAQAGEKPMEVAPVVQGDNAQDAPQSRWTRQRRPEPSKAPEKRAKRPQKEKSTGTPLRSTAPGDKLRYSRVEPRRAPNRRDK